MSKPKSIEITLEKVLTAARRLFKQGKLQCQTNPGGCDYAGPCVVGAALTPKQREYLDNADDGRGTGISALVKMKCVIIPPGDRRAIYRLQALHDRVEPMEYDEGKSLAAFKKALFKDTKR